MNLEILKKYAVLKEDGFWYLHDTLRIGILGNKDRISAFVLEFKGTEFGKDEEYWIVLKEIKTLTELESIFFHITDQKLTLTNK